MVLGGLVGAVFAGAIYLFSVGPHVSVRVVGSSSSSIHPFSAGYAIAKVMPATVDVFGSYDNGDLSAGTGVVVSPDGLVLTNDHVVNGASAVSVAFFDQRLRVPARIVKESKADDLALVRIEHASGLPVAHLGDPSRLAVGDSVVVIGNSLDLPGPPTVTMGIVSALHRNVAVRNERGGVEDLSDLIQVDAPVNPGNSGGPLSTADGEVVGITTAGATAGTPEGGSPANVGFAIPVSTALRDFPVIRHEAGASHASRVYLGVVVAELNPSVASALGVARAQGLYIETVYPGSPAAAAGVQPGDVIVGVDDVPVSSQRQLVEYLEKSKVGQYVVLDIFRGQQPLRLKVRLGAAP
jgi:S1-C subfamily serine protease